MCFLSAIYIAAYNISTCIFFRLTYALMHLCIILGKRFNQTGSTSTLLCFMAGWIFFLLTLLLNTYMHHYRQGASVTRNTAPPHCCVSWWSQLSCGVIPSFQCTGYCAQISHHCQIQTYCHNIFPHYFHVGSIRVSLYILVSNVISVWSLYICKDRMAFGSQAA